MKKLLFLIFVVFASFSSCKKSGDGIKYTQDQLNGTWESIAKDENGCVNQLMITANSLKENTVCSGSSTTITYESYSFNGSTINAKFAGVNVSYKINEVTAIKLIVTASAFGETSKAEYKKK